MNYDIKYIAMYMFNVKTENELTTDMLNKARNVMFGIKHGKVQTRIPNSLKIKNTYDSIMKSM